MNILAVETSCSIASVAIKTAEGICATETMAQSKTHARDLPDLVHQLLSKMNLKVSDLGAIAFGSGPGSFTGLRVACSFVKGLAYPHGIGLIPVSTLAVIAYQARKLSGLEKATVLAVIDARMQELYWRVDKVDVHDTKEKVSAASEIQVAEDDIILAGVGFDSYESLFPHALQAQISQKIVTMPEASAMIELAESGRYQVVSPAEAKPVYVRNKVTQGSTRG